MSTRTILSQQVMAIDKGKKKKRLQREQENTPTGRQSEYVYIENSTEIIFKRLRVHQSIKVQSECRT